jgi:DNA primase
MNTIPDAQVADARAVRMEDVIARRGIKLRRSGKELIGACPQCGGEDRFGVNTAKQVFNCRQCKATGDVISLIEHIDRCDFTAAVETLTGKSKPSSKATNGKDELRKIVVAEFFYHDENGSIAFAVERQEYRNADGTFVLKDGKHKKTFVQKRPNGDDDWIYNLKGVAPLPYHLPELQEAIAAGHSIVIVEGEAKVELLRSWNIPSTCCAGGAKKWRAEHSEFLRGADVIIIPDSDKSGRDHADVVGASLQGVAASVRLLELPDLPPKGDIIDFAAAGGTVEQLNELIEQRAKPWVPNADAGDGWKYHNATPVEPTRWLIKNILPETGVALIAGQYRCDRRWHRSFRQSGRDWDTRQQREGRRGRYGVGAPGRSRAVRVRQEYPASRAQAARWCCRDRASVPSTGA